MRILQLSAIVAFVLYSSAVVAQSAPGSIPVDLVFERIDKIEDRVHAQMQPLSQLINLGALVVAIVVGGLSIWGITSYRSILADVRRRLETRINELGAMQGQVQTNLSDAKELYEQVQKIAGIEEEMSPSTLLMRARASDNDKAVTLLSRLASIQDITADYLEEGGMLAQQIDAKTLAKLMLSSAVKSGTASDSAKAGLAVLCAKDQDWPEHQRSLDALLEQNKTNATIIGYVADFYLAREDWEGLEKAMAKAEAYAPFSPIPPRNRARAAQELGKAREQIVGSYERALSTPTGATDLRSLHWALRYLYNAGMPRTDADAARAEELLTDLLTINPEDGDSRVWLSKLMYRRGDQAGAQRNLSIALRFATNPGLIKEAEALQLVWGEAMEPDNQLEADSTMPKVVPTGIETSSSSSPT